MRLIFSSSNHLNTDISDEQGNVLYRISTPSALSPKATAVKKFNQGGPESATETTGVIEWPRLLSDGQFLFGGKVIPVDEMFEKHRWETGLYFVGSDQRSYKWKLSPHCWMKPADSDVELVRYHRKNWGVLKPAHPAYLDVSPRVVFMLDLVILTFVYAEWLRQRREARQSAAVPARGGAIGIPSSAPSC